MLSIHRKRNFYAAFYYLHAVHCMLHSIRAIIIALFCGFFIVFVMAAVARFNNFKYEFLSRKIDMHFIYKHSIAYFFNWQPSISMVRNDSASLFIYFFQKHWIISNHEREQLGINNPTEINRQHLNYDFGSVFHFVYIKLNAVVPICVRESLIL